MKALTKAMLLLIASMGLFALACALLAHSSPANAQALCLPNATLADDLRSGFGEVPIVAAMTPAAPFVIYANQNTGTFTVVLVGPESSCITHAGTDFEVIMSGDPA